MADQLRIAADIGGTFTDIALMLADGTVAISKVPSTPDDYSRGVIDGINGLLGELQIAPAAIGDVLHGCTVATNAILEGKGAKTALVTTKGFRDVLEFRRVRVPRLYDPLYVKPEPLAPRDRRFEVTERLAADGSVVVALDEAEVEAVAESLQQAGVEAVAVAFLHSYVNPAHEQRAGAILRERLPGVFVTLSCEVLPEIREYERTSTTVINAYVGPPVATYIANLQAALKTNGLTGPLLVMQSTGGILAGDTVTRMPARIVECGPAAGVIGALHQARVCGHPNVITLDMGGTTAKAAMIENGALVRTDEYEVGGGISLSSRLVKGGGYALKLPMIDISEVGAGGGSLAWFDRGGALKVGPQSAGAVPGPACYGAGGTHATVTDANVVLGFINPVALAGGTVPLDAALAHAAIEREVAAPLRCAARDAAWAVHVVATANMMRAVKAVSTYRGRDPRDCVLMAFGGNGGIFAVELARQLQIRTVLVPPAAGVWSAVGLNVAPVEYGQTRANLKPLSTIDAGHLAGVLASLDDEVCAMLGRPRGEIDVAHVAAMRYVGQAFELTIPLHGIGFAARTASLTPSSRTEADTPNLTRGDDWAEPLRAAFAREHERTYGHRSDADADVEIVAVQAIGTVRSTANARRRIDRRLRRATAAATRECYFGPDAGAVATPVIDRAALSSAARPGPLVIEEYEGTTVVPPGASASLDTHGNIVIATGVADAPATPATSARHAQEQPA